ncbi:MAG TPA: DUF1573 domain-containing protein [Candidatus Heimdallarchaeota archaeon]|nr:DUF1573 domain-containing protein [Candidatus Heimdallarchaeota archaeon]
MNKHNTFALLAVLSIAVAATAAPIIEVDNADYDFGKLAGAPAVTHHFIISNVGDEPLSILDVRTSCGCTTTALSKSDLAPGESVELEVTVDLTSFSGHISQAIYVSSNDLIHRKLTLHITGQVIPAQPHHITAEDLSALLYLLIDLRSPQAYAAGHIAGAINIPFQELESWIDRLPTEVHTIVLYDQTGSLSDQAVYRFSAAGLDQARSLLGGLDEWKRQYKDNYLFPFGQ